MRVQGSGFSVQDLAFCVYYLGIRGPGASGGEGLEIRVQDSGFRVWGLGFMVLRDLDLGFVVYGLEFRVED